MCAYKPPMIKGGNYGPKGLSKIQFSPDGKKVRVSIKGDKAYVVRKSKCPDSLREGLWYVQMSADTLEVTSVRPANGTYTVKVEKFAARDGEQPAPKTNTEYDYQYFSVILRITKGECAGMNIPLQLHYKFKAGTDKEGHEVVGFPAYDPKRAKHTPFLIKFCEITGVWERGPIMWKDNILPTLQKRILNADKEFGVVMEGGWVTNLVSTSNELKSEELPDEAPWGSDESDDNSEANSLADEGGME